ncbi:MAG TPA: hypothetical protein VGL73_10075 [Caulobacteraceae bacterium]
MDWVSVLRWATTGALVVALVIFAIRGEIGRGGGRSGFNRRESPAAFWGLIGVAAVLLVLSMAAGFP